MLGIIGGAGALTAMVPSAVLMLTAAASFAKNSYRPIFAPGMTDDAVARLARIIVVLLSGLSLYLAIYRSATLVSLLLLGYAGMVQFFPGVVLGLFWTRVTKTAVFSGMVVGVLTVIALASLKMDPLWGLNAGFVALSLNCLVTCTMSALAPVPVAPTQPEEAAVSWNSLVTFAISALAPIVPTQPEDTAISWNAGVG
jgi:SSS family solute:Na+ symporter